MSIAFRFARPEDLDEVIHLVGHSFPGVARTPESWKERFSETSYGDGPEILWVGEDSRGLVASCQLHRIAHWISGVEMSAMGLGTVAMAPTHRQRGLGGRLVETALHAAHERGDLLTSLYPFRASFYGRLGYGMAGEAYQHHLPTAALPASEERDRIEIMRGEAGLAEVRELYVAWAPTQTGQVRRTERLWREMALGPDRILVGYRGRGGRLEGYALATYPMQLPPDDRYLSVDEHAWLTPEARRGLYGWLASLGDQWRAVVLRTLPEHRLTDWLREPRLGGGRVPSWGLWFPSAAVMGGPMLRLLDLEGAWRIRRVDPEAALTLALDVQDAQLAGNAGRWRMRLEGGAVEVGRGEGPADVTLSLDVQTLSRIFVGAIPPAAAVEAGLAVAEGAGRLEELARALRLPQPWTFDRY